MQVLQFSSAGVEETAELPQLQLAVSGLVIACPLCATTGAVWFGLQKTALVPQLQLADHRDFAVTVRAGWSMSLLCRSSWIPGAVVKETVEISQLLLLRNRWLGGPGSSPCALG